jgi:hypothetical protein
VKLPVEAAAIVLVAGLAIMVFQRSSELQYASHLNEAPPPVALPPEPAKESPADSTTSLATRPPVTEPAPPLQTELSFRPPSKTTSAPESREDARDPRMAPPSHAQRQGHSESSRDLARVVVPTERAKKSDAPSTGAHQEAAPSTEPPAGNTLGTVTPAPTAAAPPPTAAPPTGSAPPSTAAAPAPTAPPPTAAAPAPAAPPLSAAQSLAKQAAPERRAAAAAPDARLEARLAVKDRPSAEATVRDLVTRAGGRVASVPDGSPSVGLVPPPADTNAPVLLLIVPAERWDEVRRGLEALGTLRVTGQKVDRAGQIVITLRLER